MGGFLAAIVTFVVWITEIIDMAISAVLNQIVEAFNSLDLSAFQSVSLASLEYIGYANAILPVSEFVVLLSLYVTAWLTIIIIRWVKSFIPTVAN